LFEDPFARQLAGARGAEIAAAMPFSERNEWAWIARTYLFDQFVTEQVQAGVKRIVNLGAGLDTRPYRLALPPSLHWVEIDLPAALNYKEEILASAVPRCRLERIRCDLLDASGRRDVFSRLRPSDGPALILTEGVLVYLSDQEVGALASDLSAVIGFDHWVLELQSPGLLRMLQKRMGRPLQEANVLPKFAPSAGPHFFEPWGWRPAVVLSLLKTAARPSPRIVRGTARNGSVAGGRIDDRLRTGHIRERIAALLRAVDCHDASGGLAGSFCKPGAYGIVEKPKLPANRSWLFSLTP
jgi:methyltransferase (TIGR00027 family)